MNKETLSELNERLDALEYELATIRSAEVAVRQIAKDIRELLGPKYAVGVDFDNAYRSTLKDVLTEKSKK